MYIQSNYINNDYSYNVSMQKAHKNNNAWRRFTARIQQKFINVLPQEDFTSNSKKIDKRGSIDNRITRPMENRLIMGAASLLTQPAIDYYNHRVDEETRTVSRNRTIAKILAGTAVGAIVRGACYKLVTKTTDIKGKKKSSRALLPSDKGILREFLQHSEKLSNYRNALSTFVAIVVMCFTNFLLDAPLTAILTNMFNAKSRENAMKKKKTEMEATYV